LADRIDYVGTYKEKGMEERAAKKRKGKVDCIEGRNRYRKVR
jgi:hypothetical protein